MSNVDASVGDASSEAASAASSAVVEAPASGTSVDASDSSVDGPALQSQPQQEATVDAGRGKRVTVTLEAPCFGKKKLTSWCWRFVSRFTPSINGKNVVCLVKKGDGTPCNHLMKWSPSGGGNKGSGTTGLMRHLEGAHAEAVKQAKEEEGSQEERKASIKAAIGEILCWLNHSSSTNNTRKKNS